MMMVLRNAECNTGKCLLMIFEPKHLFCSSIPSWFIWFYKVMKAFPNMKFLLILFFFIFLFHFSILFSLIFLTSYYYYASYFTTFIFFHFQPTPIVILFNIFIYFIVFLYILCLLIVWRKRKSYNEMDELEWRK